MILNKKDPVCSQICMDIEDGMVSSSSQEYDFLIILHIKILEKLDGLLKFLKVLNLKISFFLQKAGQQASNCLQSLF